MQLSNMSQFDLNYISVRNMSRTAHYLSSQILLQLSLSSVSAKRKNRVVLALKLVSI